MTLKCTCTHLRVDHDGGKKSVNDRRIGVCKECKCVEYSADLESRKRKNEIILASLTLPFILIVVCIAGFAISWLAVDFILEEFTITSEFEYKKFLNGEEVKYTNAMGFIPLEPKERVSYFMKEIVGIIFMGVAMFGGLFSFFGYYEQKLNKLIGGEI